MVYYAQDMIIHIIIHTRDTKPLVFSSIGSDPSSRFVYLRSESNEIGEGCFEMECVKKNRAPARCKVQRAPVPGKITAHPGKFGCARGGRAKFHGFGCWPVQFLIKKIISLKF